MNKRLRKLGIDKEDPDELSAEEKVKFARLDIDPSKVGLHAAIKPLLSRSTTEKVNSPPKYSRAR
eukprot:2249355-Pyramimonas_sp.AAC.2